MSGNGKGNGQAASGGISAPGADAVVLDASMDPDVPPPEQVLELAAACVRFVQTKFKIQMDFTRDTLPMLDHYLLQARASVDQRPETLALTAHAAGAYLGEIARRLYPCWWRLDLSDAGAWRLEFRDVFLAFYPVQVAYTALTRDANDEAFPGFEIPSAEREPIKGRLGELPPVSEDEYYSPSARLEVLDIVVDAMMANAIQTRNIKRAYRPDDYE